MKRKTSYSIARVLNLRTKIENDSEILTFLFSPLEGEAFQVFVETLKQLLPPPIDSGALEDSCLSLLGEELTPANLSALAWRLAGNLNLLKNGHPILPWDGQEKPEEVPAQVIGWRIQSSRQGKPGAEFTLRVLAGRPAGLITRQFWSRGHCGMLSSRFGFSKWSSGPYPFLDVRQLSDLRCYVRIVPGKAELQFDQLSFPPSILNWNRRFIRRRARTEFQCPLDFPPERYCFQCHVGRDQCPAAVHPKTYVRQNCKKCGRQTWFDTATRDENCVNCTVLEALKRKQE